MLRKAQSKGLSHMDEPPVNWQQLELLGCQAESLVSPGSEGTMGRAEAAPDPVPGAKAQANTNPKKLISVLTPTMWVFCNFNLAYSHKKP